MGRWNPFRLSRLLPDIMFADSVVVTFTGGKGGNGCASFRREKYVPKGGPDGGDGGHGGSVILVSEKSNKSLVDFQYKQVIKAQNGVNGSGSNKTGRCGEDRIIYVPAGTLIKSYPEENILFDFSAEDMRFTIAQGGKGGSGNTRFKSSINRAPRRFTHGAKGETITVVLELKLIAFAGLVGFPNAGKSTLISKISGAKPKIADYPFTTLTPHLGVVYKDYDSLVVADIPGIIEGAHTGEGMGLNFLKHIERNRVLVFLLDASPYAERTPLEALKILQDELKSYSLKLKRKRFLVVANKIDLLPPDQQEDEPDPHHTALADLQDYCKKSNLPYLEISAVKEMNLHSFKDKLFQIYHEQN